MNEASRVQKLLIAQETEIVSLKQRIEALEKALRETYEVYAGSEGIPQPMTAAEGYLLHLVKEMANIAAAALEEKKE